MRTFAKLAGKILGDTVLVREGSLYQYTGSRVSWNKKISMNNDKQMLLNYKDIQFCE